MKKGFRVSGTGIPNGAVIESIDSSTKFTIDVNPTASNSGVTVTFTYYKYVSDKWIQDRRDNYVIPWIEDKIRLGITAEQEYTEYHSGNGSSILVLNRKPVNEVTQIRFLETGSVDSDYLADLGSVELLKDMGIIKALRNYDEPVYKNPFFPRGTMNIEVTIKAGYDSMPGDIKEAVMHLTAEALLGLVGNRTGGGSVGVQGYSKSFGKRGKFTEIRNDLARSGIALLRKYMSGNVGA
ncbi:MAG: hypothetical protein GF388_08530 [Candidatus Aegiribacteria sp.]|nr:hypothetical protein [Candidatus Aegiribacteria sp.]